VTARLQFALEALGGLQSIYVTGFRKINHFVTFGTLNISSSNKVLHSTSRHCSEYRIIQYHELPEILSNILRTACILLWQQHKVLSSIYFTREKVVDFPKFGHICSSIYLSLMSVYAPTAKATPCVEAKLTDDFQCTLDTLSA